MTDKEQVLEYKIKSLTQERDHLKEKARIYEDAYNDQVEYAEAFNKQFWESQKRMDKSFKRVHIAIMVVSVLFWFFPLYLWAILGSWSWTYIASTLVWVGVFIINFLQYKRLKGKEKKDNE